MRRRTWRPGGRWFKFRYLCRQCGEGEIEASVTPAVAPVPCSNPDHSHYSDPGGDAEVEMERNDCPKCGAPINEDSVLDDGLRQASQYDAGEEPD